MVAVGWGRDQGGRLSSWMLPWDVEDVLVLLPAKGVITHFSFSVKCSLYYVSIGAAVTLSYWDYLNLYYVFYLLIGVVPEAWEHHFPWEYPGAHLSKPLRLYSCAQMWKNTSVCSYSMTTFCINPVLCTPNTGKSSEGCSSKPIHSFLLRPNISGWATVCLPRVEVKVA